MPRLAANLSMMFTEVPFLDRFALARAHGFDGVEFLFPYDHPAADIKARLADHGLTLALFNLPPGDWHAGERGLATLPGRGAEFRDGVTRALDYAAALDCRLLHCMAGIPPAGLPRATAASLYATRLAEAVAQAAPAGIRLTIEPINARDMPGYFLVHQAEGAAISAAFGADRLGLQFDIYHCQVTEGDLATRIERHFDTIAHLQIADVPGRHEPGTGEIGWRYLFDRIDALGYAGWVGCEYRPAGTTVDGLIWRASHGV